MQKELILKLSTHPEYLIYGIGFLFFIGFVIVLFYMVKEKVKEIKEKSFHKK